MKKRYFRGTKTKNGINYNIGRHFMWKEDEESRWSEKYNTNISNLIDELMDTREAKKLAEYNDYLEKMGYGPGDVGPIVSYLDELGLLNTVDHYEENGHVYYDRDDLKLGIRYALCEVIHAKLYSIVEGKPLISKDDFYESKFYDQIFGDATNMSYYIGDVIPFEE